MATASTALKSGVEEFLYREAWLLDNYRYREWFDLLTEDIRYWIPTVETVYGKIESYREEGPYLAYVDDDRTRLEMRLMQLETGLRHSEIPPSVFQRLITNILVESAEREDEVKVYSNLQLTQIRHGKYESVWRARREDRLRNVAEQWKLAERKVFLLGSILPRTLGVFL